MLDTQRFSAFDQYLRDNAVPFDGISNTDGTAAGLVIQFRASATAEQIAWATNARDTFDFRARQALGRNTIVSEIANLTTAQQNAIVRHAVAFLMRQNASEMASIAAVVGIALPVDEVVPT